MRNLGYSKNAGEFVRRYFADIGSAGGHRAMAKAVIPMRAFREKFGALEAASVGARLQELVTQFLHEAAAAPEKKRERQHRQRTSNSRPGVLRSTFPRSCQPHRSRSRRPPAR